MDKAALQAFVDERRAAGSGTATINRYLSVVSGIADHVRELPGWPEVNPVKLLPKKPRKEKRRSYVRPPAEHIEAIINHANGTFADFCRFALLTGARLSEIASLQMADARGGKAQLWETKHKFRVITLQPEVRTIVERQPERKGGFVFTTTQGNPYRRASELWRDVRRRAQQAAQKEGRSIGHMRFHDLRHEFAIRYLENGGNLYILQQHLGHSSIRQTEDYLRYLTPEQASRTKSDSAQ